MVEAAHVLIPEAITCISASQEASSGKSENIIVTSCQISYGVWDQGRNIRATNRNRQRMDSPDSRF